MVKRPDDIKLNSTQSDSTEVSLDGSIIKIKELIFSPNLSTAIYLVNIFILLLLRVIKAI